MPNADALPGFHVLRIAVGERQGRDVIAAEVQIHLRQEPAALAGVGGLRCGGSRNDRAASNTA